jgi:hypothetical protein
MQSTTAQALTSFPENPQLYIFAYTITDIMHILNKSASWYISFELSGLLAEYPISTLTMLHTFLQKVFRNFKESSGKVAPC